MRRKPKSLRYSGLIAFGACVGLAALIASRPSAAPPPVDTKPPEHKAKAVSLEELTYTAPKVLQALQHMDAAARRTAAPAWNHKGWHWRFLQGNSPPLHHYRAQWCSRVTEQGYCIRSGRPCDWIMLYTNSFREDEPRVVRSAHVSAGRIPADDGWGVNLLYSLTNPKDRPTYHENFGVRFTRDAADGDAEETLPIPGRGYSATHRFGDVEYHVTVGGRPEPGDYDAQRFLASPKALRDSGLQVLDDLEQLARREIASGAAIQTVIDHSEMGKSGDNGVPELRPARFEPPIPAAYSLAPEQREAILREALWEIDRRRNLLRKHYEELYAALNATFPLGDAMKEFWEQQ